METHQISVACFTCLFVLYILLIYHFKEFHPRPMNQNNHSNNSNSNSSSNPSIWVSMSLCWSKNAQIHKKSNFPYTLAANLSTRLWREVTRGKVGVVLTIVHDEDYDAKHLDDFVDIFANDDGVVVIREETSSLGCVLQSQLSRMFAFSHDFIDDDDIIITSDVDIFIMDKRIIEPLKLPYVIWIYRYSHKYC